MAVRAKNSTNSKHNVTLCLELVLVFTGFLANVRYMSSPVRLSSVVRHLSVTFVRPTQAIEIFGNVSTTLTFGTLAIC